MQIVYDQDQMLAIQLIESTIQNSSFNQHILIKGEAGSGKSAVIKAAIARLCIINHPISVTAFTSRATNKLRDGISGICPESSISTTGRLFGFWFDKFGYINWREITPKFQAGHVIFIDECGMQDGKAAKFIIDVANAQNCLLVMVGDPYQIPYIENNKYVESPVFADLSFTQIELSGCYRQDATEKNGLYQLAKGIRASVDGGKFPDFLSFSCVEKLPFTSFIDAASKRFKNGDSVKIISISGSNAEVDGLNRGVKKKVLPSRSNSAFQEHEILITLADMETAQGFISKDTDLIVESVSKPKKSSLGIRVNDYVCRSITDDKRVEFSAALNVEEAVVVHRNLKSELKQSLESGNKLGANEIRKKISDYERFAAPVNSAYAVNIISSQGSDYDHVFLDLTGLRNKYDRNLLLRKIYVGVTRARKSLTITGSFPKNL
ncbi:AAA family ATPase [Microbulbifer sp. JTAC008]|uniref:AAA family ATPase n=1 Tax=unclassified Microbulbifer TaxID=2619833 RepID=UPI00403A04FB